MLASSPGDQRKSGLGHGIIRIERFRGQQFLLTVVEIARLAVDDAQFPVKVGFRPAVTARRDCFLQLPDRFRPVVSGLGFNTAVGQRVRTVQDAPLFLDSVVASHQLLGLSLICRPQCLRQAKQRLGKVRIDRDCIPPSRYCLRSLGLLLERLTKHIPGHGVPGLQFDGLFEKARCKLRLALLLVNEGEKIARLGHLRSQPAGGFEITLRLGGAA